jgi:hypothetical protein
LDLVVAYHQLALLVLPLQLLRTHVGHLDVVGLLTHSVFVAVLPLELLLKSTVLYEEMVDLRQRFGVVAPQSIVLFLQFPHHLLQVIDRGSLPLLVFRRRFGTCLLLFL